MYQIAFQQLGKFTLSSFMCKHTLFVAPSLVLILEYYSYFSDFVGEMDLISVFISLPLVR